MYPAPATAVHGECLVPVPLMHSADAAGNAHTRKLYQEIPGWELNKQV